MDENTFFKRRKNLLGISVFILAYLWLDVELSVINLFGNELKIKEPQSVNYILMILFTYFLIRYILILIKRPFPTVLQKNRSDPRVELLEAFRYHFWKKVNDLILIEIIDKLSIPNASIKLRNSAPEDFVGYGFSESVHYIIEYNNAENENENGKMEFKYEDFKKQYIFTCLRLIIHDVFLGYFLPLILALMTITWAFLKMI
jgi:hypothetical protein